MMSWFPPSFIPRNKRYLIKSLFLDPKKLTISGYLLPKGSTISLRKNLWLGLKFFQVPLKDKVVEQGKKRILTSSIYSKENKEMQRYVDRKTRDG